MTFKKIVAVAALAALSLVVACSGSNGANAGSGMLPVSPGAAAPAFADGVDGTALDAANAKSPIKLSPKSLEFTAAGEAAAKSFKAFEAKYKGLFTIASTCGTNVKITPPKHKKGPDATFGVVAVKDVACHITVTDKAKNKAALSVIVRIPVPTPTPTTAPTATPTPVPTATPTTKPTATPTSKPTATPTPAAAAIVNGNFASGSLAPGWKACSFSHPGYTAPVNASPAPQGTAAQPLTATAPISASNLATFGNKVGTPPPNYNPNNNGPIPSGLTGGHAAMTGDQNSENAGAAGICQTFTVNAANHFLSFYAYEGGSEYSFGYADQEADIMDATGSTIQKTLFAEDNCFWNPGKIGATGYLGSGCIPAAFGSTSSYTDWQGGYWVQRGPYDLSAYVGKSVTLFLGVWDDSTNNTPYPDTYSNEMFVGNVQMSSSSTFPVTFNGVSRKR
jgi:hypothetical protein